MNLYQRSFVYVVTALIFFIILSPAVFAAPIELSLEDSIALALENNPDIKMANLGRQRSSWVLKQAEAAKGFVVGYNHTNQRYNTPPSSSTPYYVWTTKDDNSFTLSLPLYTGGKLENQIDQAKLNMKVEDLNVDATKQQIKQSVTSYYFEILKYRNNLAVSQETVDNYMQHLKTVELQYESGLVAKNDVLSSEVSLANARTDLIKVNNNYDLAVASLNNVMGLPLESELKLKENLQYEKYAPSLEDCIQYALDNRPELAAYQAKIAIAQDDLKIAQSGYLPTVSFNAKEDWYSERAGWYHSRYSNSDTNNWYVGVTVSMSIFDSGLNKAKVQQSQYGLDTTQEEARKERDTVLLEVRQAYLSVREAENRMNTSQVAVHKAEDSLRIAEVRYRAGLGTNLDVLDAVLDLSQVKLNYVQALYDYNNSRGQLDKAMGVAVK